MIDVASSDEANELFQRNGWTDGLPIVAPTPDRVAAMLDWVGLPDDHVFGVEPVRMLPLPAAKVAANAVMAGCLPPYFPVVAAAIEAMCDPDYLLHGSAASTGGSATLIVVNGPIGVEIGMNATHNVLGNGNRPNASIGRAVRLSLVNLLGCIPGRLDRSTLGHPGKYTLCIAEDEADSPWVPLAQERGIPAGTSAVTVLAVESPRQVMNEWTEDPAEICETLAGEIRANQLSYSIHAGNYAVVIPKQLRDLVARAGWQKSDVKACVAASARIRRRDWAGVGKGAMAARGDPDREYRALQLPDDLLVIAAGGPAGGFAAIFPPWYGQKSRAVTKPIGACVQC